MAKPLSSQIQPPGLYIIATPIGNLGDISLRALEVLKNIDLIACEDTRISGKLLNHFGIKATLLSYNDHNGHERRPQIMKALAEQKCVALMSDAGTPLISDPGYKLVREVVDAGYYVTALPGASSVMAALCISGLPTDRFFFGGFLPNKQDACRKELAALKDIPSTLVFFESPKRLANMLAVAAETLGNRQASVLRELTKLHEERKSGTLSELAQHYAKHEAKGEAVVVIAPPLEEKISGEDLKTQLLQALQNHSVKDAAELLSEITGRPRKEIYELALRLRNDDEF